MPSSSKGTSIKDVYTRKEGVESKSGQWGWFHGVQTFKFVVGLLAIDFVTSGHCVHYRNTTVPCQHYYVIPYDVMAVQCLQSLHYSLH